MKLEKIVAGIIIIGIGIFISYSGYQDMRPSKIEQGIGILNELSKNLGGEKLPALYKKDLTLPILTLIAGGIISIIGLRYILKARE